MKKMLLIINPKSGKLLVQAALFGITEVFCMAEYLVTTRFTLAPGDAEKMAREGAVEGQYDLIVCCGGDGTLNGVLSGVAKSGKKVPIGFIPAGSTNDFANSMKMPTEPILAAESIVKTEEPVRLDIGRFNGERYFSYIASFGAFTATSYNVPQDMKNALGHFAYVLGGIKDLTTIKPYHIEAFSDDRDFEGDYIFGAVCNSYSVGGVIKLSGNGVNLNDGLFEVLFVKQPKNPVQLNKILWGLINTDFSDEEVFEFFRASKIAFKMPEDVNWTLDGEFEKGTDTVVIENMNSAIEIMYTADGTKGV